MAELPEYLVPVVQFAAATGWRLMECLSLRWTAVDFAAGTIRLEPGETKSRPGTRFSVQTVPVTRRRLGGTSSGTVGNRA